MLSRKGYLVEFFNNDEPSEAKFFEFKQEALDFFHIQGNLFEYVGFYKIKLTKAKINIRMQECEE